MTPDASTPVPSPGGDVVPFPAALRVWARVAALSFGGPAGQIAVMHRIVVDEQRWVGEARFLHALNFCMLLPGPEAHQLAIYLGWLLNGVRGAVAAGLLFVLPGFVAMLALSVAYVTLGETPLVAGLFFGLRAAVVAIVLQALLRIGGRTLTSPATIAVAALAFVALGFLGAPFPLVVLVAGLVGWAAARAGVAGLAPGHGHAARGGLADRDSALGEEPPAPDRGRLRGVLRVAGLTAALWLAPVGVLLLALGPDNVFARIAGFFSLLAVVTFGGAYAVLAYLGQAAVASYGWLTPAEMLDGLGLAETTPGPLIMVVQFIGFLAAYRNPGTLDPMLAATLGAILTTWVTFVPSFLWILAGAPFVERLRGARGLGGALRAITAAVVGVILNLALWFASHVVFAAHVPVRTGWLHFDRPVLASADPLALALVAGALVAVFVLRLGLLATLGLAAAAGAALRLAGLG
ncbi:chromate efflux transporter [Amaricoccus sp.]|uniref:chromate efflux transporter n=1 Tax=Amaricoccus sp. TaxID=1872485 RepID=UPI001B6BD837|nr:chromate efflux transporter [Amaricoccus sp.]MBP7000817.1 chromate efflux transporter [Amaricoccus sp.]